MDQNKLLKGQCKKLRPGSEGFTLIELLIVMMIIGLLASLVGPAMFGKVDSSRVQAAQSQIKMIETALDTYRLDTGRYPESLDKLVTSSEVGWAGPYYPKGIPKDPWGRDYKYELSDLTGYVLISLGADGVVGGEGIDADIAN